MLSVNWTGTDTLCSFSSWTDYTVIRRGKGTSIYHVLPFLSFMIRIACNCISTFFCTIIFLNSLKSSAASTVCRMAYGREDRITHRIKNPRDTRTTPACWKFSSDWHSVERACSNCISRFSLSTFPSRTSQAIVYVFWSTCLQYHYDGTRGGSQGEFTTAVCVASWTTPVDLIFESASSCKGPEDKHKATNTQVKVAGTPWA